MHRIQIQLSLKQERALRELSKLRGESISALVREGVDRLLAPERDASESARRRALDLTGMLDSALPEDFSENHDRYIADAIEAGHAAR